MMFLAGAAAGGVIDLISSLKQTTGSGKSKAGPAVESIFGVPASQSGSTSTSDIATTSSSSSGSVSPGTMRALLWLQAHGIDVSSSIMSALDADGSGDVSQSEFETMFARNGDATKAEAVFAKLDTDSDGAVSAEELAAGLRAAHRHRGPQDLASANADGSGDSSRTVTNTDGSTTTTITYTDGSQVTMTKPATSSGATANLLERLIQRQAEMLTRTSSGQTLATAA